MAKALSECQFYDFLSQLFQAFGHLILYPVMIPEINPPIMTSNLLSKKLMGSAFGLLILITVFTVSCSKKDSGSNPTTDPPVTSNAVSITSMSFSPAPLNASAGATITWTNNDNVAHTVTADDNSFDSGSIAPGGKYTRTFATAGTYPYHCTFHAAMSASVIVK
jgi:plastocyanin